MDEETSKLQPILGKNIHETTMSDEEKPIKYDYFSINKNVEIIFSYNFDQDLNDNEMKY